MTKRPRPSDDLGSLVGEAMEGIAEEESRHRQATQSHEARRQQRRRLEINLALALIPVALLLTALNVGGYGTRVLAAGAPALEPAAADQAARELLRDAVDELQWAFAEEGRYPSRPGFLLPEPDGDDAFDYELKSPNHYVLTVTIDGHAATFDSNHDDADRLGAVHRGR